MVNLARVELVKSASKTFPNHSLLPFGLGLILLCYQTLCKSLAYGFSLTLDEGPECVNDAYLGRL